MDINYSNPVDFKLKDYDEKPKIYNLGFREYDARWLYPEQINLAGIQKIGLGLGKLIKQSTSYSFEFDEPAEAITRGQACVLYDNDRVLGGGIIKQKLN